MSILIIVNNLMQVLVIFFVNHPQSLVKRVLTMSSDCLINLSFAGIC